MKQGRIAEAKAVLRKLHGGGGAGGAGGGQTDDEIGREVDGMGGNKGEEHKGNVLWAEVRRVKKRARIGIGEAARLSIRWLDCAAACFSSGFLNEPDERWTNQPQRPLSLFTTFHCHHHHDLLLQIMMTSLSAIAA